jgi:hypothetical protein
LFGEADESIANRWGGVNGFAGLGVMLGADLWEIPVKEDEWGLIWRESGVKRRVGLCYY